jgi:hypothetical protein
LAELKWLALAGSK